MRRSVPALLSVCLITATTATAAADEWVVVEDEAGFDAETDLSREDVGLDPAGPPKPDGPKDPKGPSPPTPDGCDCHTPGGRAPREAGFALVLVLAALARRAKRP